MDATKIKTKNVENTANASGTKEILCDGYFYDVTNFISRHPGGSIIKFYTESGEDATHAIQQFHQRSAGRVSSIMGALKKRPASNSERTEIANEFCLTKFSISTIFQSHWMRQC